MRLPRDYSKLQEVGNSSYLVYFIFLSRKMVGCSSSYRASFAQANCASPRQEHRASLGRRGLRLGEGKVCLGEGVCLSEGTYA